MAIPTDSDLVELSTHSFFEGFSPAELRPLISGAVIKRYKHRDFLFFAGQAAECFSLILDGAVKLIRPTPKGDDVIVHFALKGDPIAVVLMNLPDGATYPVSAKSMGPSRMLTIPKSTYQRVWRTNVPLQDRINTIVFQRMNLLHEDKSSFSSPLRVRLAKLLIRHLEQSDMDQPMKMSLSLTRQELADSLGVAVESVIRTMRDWVEDGTVSPRDAEGREYIDLKRLLENLEV